VLPLMMLVVQEGQLAWEKYCQNN